MIASAPIFFSCGDDEETQIGLPPQNDLGIFFAEIPMGDAVSQVWVNDISSRASDAILAGTYTDENFGKIKSQHFTEILLPTLNPGKSLEADASFDSLVLELRINGVFGNQLSSAIQQVEVFQLLDTIQAIEASYFNNSSQETGQKLGETFFQVYPDSIGLTFEDTGIPDSLFDGDKFDDNEVYIYKSRIRIDDAFGEDFFTKMKSDTTENSIFGTSANFANYFKGLNIRGSDLNTGVIRYNGADVRTRLVLHYTQTEDDSVVSRTLGFPVSRSINYNNIEPNEDVPWMGSAFDQITEFYRQTELDTGYAFAQAGTHMFFSIDMSGFEALTDSLPNTIIQSALLSLGENLGVEGTDDVIHPGPNFLSFTVTSKDSLEAGFFDVIPEVFSELPDRDVQLDQDNGGYQIEIPLYLQGLLDKRNPLNQLIISAGRISPTLGIITTDNGSFRRAIFDTDNIVIRLYYTIPESTNDE